MILTNSHLNKIRRQITDEPEPDQSRFHMGKLHDALITATDTVDLIQRTVTDRYGKPTYYTQPEIVTGLKMRDAFMNNAYAALVLSKSELQAEKVNTVEWADMQIECSCRCDMLLQSAVVDLKKTSCNSEDEFRCKIDLYHYDQQSAFFSAVCGRPFIFLAQSSRKPYTVFRIVADQEMIENGTRKINELIPYL